MTDSLLKTGRGIPAHEKCFAAGCHNDSGWMGGVLCKQHYDQLPPNMTHGTDELTTLRDALTTMTVERDSLQSCLDKMYGIRNHLESALTARAEHERILLEQLRAIPTHVVLDVSEIPDRNSPDDQPEMMLVTGPELAAIVANRINNALEKANG